MTAIICQNLLPDIDGNLPEIQIKLMNLNLLQDWNFAPTCLVLISSNVMFSIPRMYEIFEDHFFDKIFKHSLKGKSKSIFC